MSFISHHSSLTSRDLLTTSSSIPFPVNAYRASVRENWIFIRIYFYNSMCPCRYYYYLVSTIRVNAFLHVSEKAFYFYYYSRHRVRLLTVWRISIYLIFYLVIKISRYSNFFYLNMQIREKMCVE